MESIRFTKKTWDGLERRKRRRRVEDLKQCKLCGVFFSWESCGLICSACAHKSTAPFQKKGRMVNIII